MAESSPLPVIPGDAADDGNAGPENGLGQRHSGAPQAFTTAKEYMQELPESVQAMVGSVFAMLTKGGEESSDDLPQKAANASTVTSSKLLKRMVGAAGFKRNYKSLRVNTIAMHLQMITQNIPKNIPTPVP
jgi:hypothetical protein